MECFRLLLEHLAWIQHQFLNGIRDSKKAGSLWGMMRGVGVVRKFIGQIKNFTVKDHHVSIGTISAQFDVSVGAVHTIIHEELKKRKICAMFVPRVLILVPDYLTKIGIKTVPRPPYSPDLAPCDFLLFPKLKGNLRSSRYATIEEMKEAVTNFIDTLTQEDFHGAFQKLLERYNKFIATGGDYFKGD